MNTPVAATPPLQVALCQRHSPSAGTNGEPSVSGLSPLERAPQRAGNQPAAPAAAAPIFFSIHPGAAPAGAPR
jgi:hypothetical protein